MKKYLIIGLVIILGSNLVALANVAFNRAGEVSSQLTLTERELLLPYNTRAQRENSGISFAINWRAASKDNNAYSYYSAKQIKITKKELIALGFVNPEKQSSYRSEPLEMYWALEFNGALYHDELKKSALRYKEALLTNKAQPSKEHKRLEEECRDEVAREKASNSRLFFMEASASYQALATKFKDRDDILIVKGLAKYYHVNKDKTYRLSLNNLSVSNIMVPLAHSEVFTGLSRRINRESKKPRFSVTVNWGSRLEPWVVDAQRLPN